ncbi:MAG: hypothetical protein V3U02_12560 [Calditrichia bacterium]
MGSGHGGGGGGGGGGFHTGHRHGMRMGGYLPGYALLRDDIEAYGMGGGMGGGNGVGNIDGKIGIWGNQIMGIAIPFIQVLGTATTTSSIKLAENIHRRYLFIQNIDSADDLHVGYDIASTTSMQKIEPGNAYEPIMVPTSAIHIRTDANTAKFVILWG